jgi:hypothetical protein
MLRLGFILNELLLCYLAIDMGINGIDDDKKCRQNDNVFDRHAAGVIRRGAHCPMECIRDSCKATRCRNQTSACAVLSRLPPRLTIFNF